jgi:hypothetical protein
MRCNASRGECQVKTSPLWEIWGTQKVGVDRSSRVVGVVWKCTLTRPLWKLALYRTSSSHGSEFHRALRGAF